MNKPEWPAAEVMLSLLGSLLVQQFNNKSLDQSTRVTSVDYLGTVASTLRRDAVTSQLKEHDIDVILRELTEGNQSESEEEEDEEEEESSEPSASPKKEEEGAEENGVKEEEGEGDGKDGEAQTTKKTPIKKVKKEKTEEGEVEEKKINLAKMDRILVLRDAVLDYLLEDESDPVAVVSSC